MNLEAITDLKLSKDELKALDMYFEAAKRCCAGCIEHAQKREYITAFLHGFKIGQDFTTEDKMITYEGITKDCNEIMKKLNTYSPVAKKD